MKKLQTLTIQIDDAQLLLIQDYSYRAGAPRGAVVVTIYTMTDRRLLTTAEVPDTATVEEIGAAVDKALLILFSK